MADTRIRFSVEGVQLIEEAMGRIHQQTENLTDVWIKGGSIIIEDLQEQIRLLEQRNDLGRKTLGEGFKKNISETNDLISAQIRLLRSRNEAARGGFRNETSSESGNGNQSTDNINADYGQGLNGDIKLSEAITIISDSLESLLTEGIKIHPETMEYVAELLQKSADENNERLTSQRDSRESSSPERESRGDNENRLSETLNRFFLLSAVNAISGDDPLKSLLGISQNLSQSIAGNGIIGAVAGTAGVIGTALMQAKYDRIASTAEAAAGNSRLFGGSWGDYITSKTGVPFGFSRQETSDQRLSLGRSLGSGSFGYVNNQLLDSFRWQREFGLGSSEIDDFARLRRGASRFDLGQGLSAIYGGYSRAGMNENDIKAIFSEALQGITGLGANQQMISGRSNLREITAMNSLLARNSYFRNNPQLAQAALSSIANGIRQGTTPQAEALTYRAAMQLNPGASFWELRKMRENPFESGLAAAEIAMMDRDSRGNKEVFAANIAAKYGVSASTAEALASGDISLEAFRKEYEKSGGAETENVQNELMSGVSQNVTSISTMIAKWDSLLIGDSIENIEKLLEKINSALDIFIKGGEKPPVQTKTQRQNNVFAGLSRPGMR